MSAPKRNFAIVRSGENYESIHTNKQTTFKIPAKPQNILNSVIRNKSQEQLKLPTKAKPGNMPTGRNDKDEDEPSTSKPSAPEEKRPTFFKVTDLNNPFAKKKNLPFKRMYNGFEEKKTIVVDDSQDDCDDDDLFTTEQYLKKKPHKVLDSFVMPSRKKARPEDQAPSEELHKRQREFMDEVSKAQEMQKYLKDKKRCPYCLEYFSTVTVRLQAAIDEINTKDNQYRNQQQAQLEKENAASSFAQPVGLLAKRPVSTDEKIAFCKLHKVELITKPNGRAANYPTHIDFGKIEGRIMKLQKQLREVMHGEIESDYKKIALDAYEEYGANKARSTMAVMLRFESFLPGYYGPKGSQAIFDTLSKLYLKTGYLTKEMAAPQLPMEYVQQVLVPEVGFRLIWEDLVKIALKPESSAKAKEVMADSIEYGNAMFPIVEKHEEKNDNDEEDKPSVLVINLEEDEEEEDIPNEQDHFSDDEE